MSPLNEEQTSLRLHRRKQLFDPSKLPLSLDYGSKDIQRIIPHRDPYLFLDRLTALEPGEKARLVGQRRIPENLPLFAGHFPDYPVYPGTRQVEMIGQLGLCLYHFVSRKTNVIEADYPPMVIRATRVGGAYFLKSLHPGDTLQILVELLRYDDWGGLVIGQILIDSQIACVASGEVIFLD